MNIAISKRGIDAPEKKVGEVRIVTLIASATEIVAALGARHRIVARSHECDHPPSILDLPALTAPKFKVEGSSAEIDARVRELVERGLSVYAVDADRLRDLAPGVIVTQDQCDVCAVSLSDVEAAVCGWAGAGVRVVSLRPDTLSDVYRDITRVADAIGDPPAGEALISSMQGRLATIAATARSRLPRRVAFIEWADPLMSGGNWMPELIEIAGAVSCFEASPAPGKSAVMTWDALLASDPDVIIIAPCGYDLAASKRDHAMLSGHEEWLGLRAVSAGEVYCADGNAFFNRPGPRLVETAEILAEIIHPTAFQFGHEGQAWRRMLPLSPFSRVEGQGP